MLGCDFIPALLWTSPHPFQWVLMLRALSNHQAHSSAAKTSFPESPRCDTNPPIPTQGIAQHGRVEVCLEEIGLIV